MTRKNRTIVGCLCVIGLVLVAFGTLVIVDWGAVTGRLADTVEVQGERTTATLFRLGEVMSIAAELESEYGTEPSVTYHTETGRRILSITLGDDRLPDDATAEDHAREIAAFAVGKTKKFEQIDVVEVRIRTSADGPETFSFALDQLLPAPDADPATLSIRP